MAAKPRKAKPKKAKPDKATVNKPRLDKAKPDKAKPDKPKPDKLTGVPAAEVEARMQDYRDDGATDVVKVAEGDDDPPVTYTVIATYPS